MEVLPLRYLTFSHGYFHLRSFQMATFLWRYFLTNCPLQRAALGMPNVPLLMGTPVPFPPSSTLLHARYSLCQWRAMPGKARKRHPGGCGTGKDIGGLGAWVHCRGGTCLAEERDSDVIFRSPGPGPKIKTSPTCHGGVTCALYLTVSTTVMLGILR